MNSQNFSMYFINSVFVDYFDVIPDQYIFVDFKMKKPTHFIFILTQLNTVFWN